MLSGDHGIYNDVTCGAAVKGARPIGEKGGRIRAIVPVVAARGP